MECLSVVLWYAAHGLIDDPLLIIFTVALIPTSPRLESSKLGYL